MRWLRNRVPLVAAVLLVVTALWVTYFIVPLLGAHKVDATVVENRGRPYRCEVVWSGPDNRLGGRGYVECAAAQVGDRVSVYAMGWPRSGTADDPATALILALLGAFLGFLLAGLMIGVSATQLHRLRRRFDRTSSRPPG